MGEGMLPANLLCLAAGLALAQAAAGARIPAIGLAAITALATSVVILPEGLNTLKAIAVFALIALWTTAVFLGRRLAKGVAIGLSAVTGGAVGASASLNGQPRILFALAFLLAAYLALWLRERDWAIAVKIAAGWMLAIAMLAAGLTLANGIGTRSEHLD